MKIVKSVIFCVVLLVASVQTRAQALTAGSSINNVIDAYLGVKNALAADNNPAAKIAAKKLFGAITAVPSEKLSASQKTLWAAYTDKLQFDSRHISESNAIDHQREHFTSLSKNMYEVVKGLKLNTAVIYEQYCPMKKATWLSESPAIKNPYLGSKMLTCGKTRETLTPSVK